MLTVQSSTYTTSAFNFQDGMTLGHTRAGGISIVTSHASGVIRFYTGAAVETMRLTAAGQLLIGDSVNTDITDAGLTIKSSAFDHVMAFKDPNVNTGHPTAETDSFGYFAQVQTGGGGLQMTGAAEAGANTCLLFQGLYADGGGDTTKSTTSHGIVDFDTYELSAGNYTLPDGNKNIVVFRAGGASRFIFDVEGDMHYDGAAPANYDTWDNVALLRTLDLVCKGPDLNRVCLGQVRPVPTGTIW